eukprot:scaffold36321_cov63-Attheya_sp.AAC.7
MRYFCQAPRQIVLVGSRIPKAHEGPNGSGGSVKDEYLVMLHRLQFYAQAEEPEPEKRLKDRRRLRHIFRPRPHQHLNGLWKAIVYTKV